MTPLYLPREFGQMTVILILSNDAAAGLIAESFNISQTYYDLHFENVSTTNTSLWFKELKALNI